MRTLALVGIAAFLSCVAAKELNSMTTGNVVTNADATIQAVKDTEARYAALVARQATINADLDSYWLIYNAAIVFLMQAGFALYEAGSIRNVCQSHVFFKNVLVSSVVAITWWTIGYALAFGDNRRSGTRNGFIGNGDFILVSDGTNDLDDRDFGRWFFEFTYAVIPTTMVTMALSERLRCAGLILVSFLISGFVYPVIAHWTWSNAGYLSPFVSQIGRMGPQGIFDFAGGATIFLMGGSAGFAATIAVGARSRRYGDDQSDRFRQRNKLYLTFGALIILFSTFAYTSGRSLGLSNSVQAGAPVAAKVLITTALAAVGGFLGGYPLYYFLNNGESYTASAFTDSIIAGIAAIASGVSVVEPWAALLIGAIGGLLYALLRNPIAAKVDDVVNGFATFAIPAFWGLIATGLLATEFGVRTSYGDMGNSEVRYGLFYHGGGDMLWSQLVGAIAVLAWSFAITFLLVKIPFVFLETLLKISIDDEKFGADLSVYAEYAVSDAFVDGADEQSGLLDAATGFGALALAGQDVPRWELVDFRERNAKEAEEKKKAEATKDAKKL
eukprot:PhF_6_TR20990/c0_g1_i2/m.30113/K03320/amt, AMT, MEP; ammonium transporter, Amt family